MKNRKFDLHPLQEHTGHFTFAGEGTGAPGGNSGEGTGAPGGNSGEGTGLQEGFLKDITTGILVVSADRHGRSTPGFLFHNGFSPTYLLKNGDHPGSSSPGPQNGTTR